MKVNIVSTGYGSEVVKGLSSKGLRRAWCKLAFLGETVVAPLINNREDLS